MFVIISFLTTIKIQKIRSDMTDLTELFCDVDDFVKLHNNKIDYYNKNKPNYFRPNKLSEIEIMTIVIAYHKSC